MFERISEISSYPLISGANVNALTHVRVVRFEQTISNSVLSIIDDDLVDQTRIIRIISQDTRDREQYCFAFGLELEKNWISHTGAADISELQRNRHSITNRFEYNVADLKSEFSGGYQLG